METVDDYKDLRVHTDNKLDSIKNTEALLKKGPSSLYFLRCLRSMTQDWGFITDKELTEDVESFQVSVKILDFSTHKKITMNAILPWCLLSIEAYFEKGYMQ